MKTLPSKELLSAVLGEDVTMVGIETGGLLFYRIMIEINEYDGVGYATKESPTSINIYELQHMMKEWLLDGEGYLFTKKIQYEKYHNWQLVIKKSDIVEEFMADTEPEAVTKACEWILKEISK